MDGPGARVPLGASRRAEMSCKICLFFALVSMAAGQQFEVVSASAFPGPDSPHGSDGGPGA